MPGDFLRRSPQLTMQLFHVFLNSRPKKEKWELIDRVQTGKRPVCALDPMEGLSRDAMRSDRTCA